MHQYQCYHFHGVPACGGQLAAAADRQKALLSLTAEHTNTVAAA